MALKVWFPLNGNLDNLGIAADVSLTDNTRINVDPNGKIGSCYSFNGSSNYLVMNDYDLSGMATVSFAFWVKPDTADMSYVFLARNIENQTRQHKFGIYTDGFRYRDTGHSASTTVLLDPNNQSPFTAGSWYHIAVVYDRGSVFMYKDGVLLNSYIAPAEYHLTSMNEYRIGKVESTSSSSYMDGCLNDIRIYNHALSAREVKEISKALVVHYPLNENYQIMNNVFLRPTFDSTSSTAGWSHWAPDGSTYTYSQNTNKEYIFNKANTYSHKITVTAGVRMILYQEPAFSGGYRSAQAIVKLENGSNPAPTYESSTVWIGANSMTNGGKNSCVPLGDGFYLIKKEGFYQTGSNDLVCLTISLAAGTTYVSEFYLEDNRKVCSDIFGLTRTVKDRSGYGRDASVVGPLETDTESPRYDNCTVNKENYPLRAVFDFPQSKGLTIACWIYLTDWGSQGSGLWSTSTISASNPSDYTATTCNHCDGKFYLRGTNGSTYNITCGTGVISSNAWNHLVLTHDGANIKLYVNNTLRYTQPCQTPLIHFKSLFLGYSNAGNVSRQCKGKWSDFRMYATALSAEDIADLYHTSAIIDNLGNIHSFQLEEQSENLFRIEELQKYARTGQSYILSWVDKNGEKAVGMGPSQFYENGSYKSILLDRFKENTQYKFDIWMDADAVVYNGNNVTGGLRVLYTDGTEAPYTSLTTVGNASSPMGFQHKIFYSDPEKTVKRLYTYYYIATNVYYRWDSVIMPVETDAEIKNTGENLSGQFREGAQIANISSGSMTESNQFNEI